MTSLPYFKSLAQRSLRATDLSGLRHEVVKLLEKRKLEPPHRAPDESAGKFRDEWQEVLSRALSLYDQGVGSENHEPRLDVQVRHLVSLLGRIESLTSKIPATLGDGGWPKQATDLRKKHGESEELRWDVFLGPVKPATQAPSKPETGVYTVWQRRLNRVHDAEHLINSYAPLLARRLAANLTACERIA